MSCCKDKEGEEKCACGSSEKGCCGGGGCGEGCEGDGSCKVTDGHAPSNEETGVDETK